MGALDASTLTVAAPLALLAVVGASLFARQRRQGASRSIARSWPQTMGTVISSTMQVSHSGATRHEAPLVLYTYQVDGSEFQGSRVRAADRAGRRHTATRTGTASSTVARYSAGSSVVVFYDPSNPANSALER